MTTSTRHTPGCRDRLARARLAGAIVIGLGSIFGSPAIAQQEGLSDPPARQPERQDDAPRFEINPERLRARLSSLLEEMQGATARLESAIETLDNGGSAQDAIETLGGSQRVRRLADFWGQWARPAPQADQGEQHGRRPGIEPPEGERPFVDRGPEPFAEVTAEDVRAFLDSHAPEFAARIEELAKQDPRRAEMFRNRLRPRVGEILMALRRDPEFGELLAQEFRVNMDLLDAGRRYARLVAADHPDAEQAREALRALAGEQVDLRLKRREHEIHLLTAQLEELQADVDQQRANRDTYIDEIVERAGVVSGPGPEGGERPAPSDRREQRGRRPGRDGNGG